MNFLRESVRALGYDSAITWTTPTGFKVVQSYRKYKKIDVESVFQNLSVTIQATELADPQEETESEPVEASEQPDSADSSDDGASEEPTESAEADSDGDLEAFRAQAKKLGYQLDKSERRVNNPERHAFREKMRASILKDTTRISLVRSFLD